MANTKLIRTKIKSVGNLKKIIKALEVVSTIKLQKLRQKTITLKHFFVDFLNILSIVQQQVNIFDFDKSARDPNGRRLLVVITSDKGLCGWINSKLLKHISTKYKDWKHKADIFCIWKKWLEFFVRDWRNVVGTVDLKDTFEQEDLKAVYAYIKKAVQEKTYSKIKVYFNFFKNTVSQIPLRFKIYPLDHDTFDAFLKDLDIELSSVPHLKKNQYMMIEPTISTFKQKLIEEIVQYIIYTAALNNKAGEHAARMVAMKNAKDNCTEVIDSLNLVYNKTRQQKITQEISEIVSAKIAIENN